MPDHVEFSIKMVLSRKAPGGGEGNVIRPASNSRLVASSTPAPAGVAGAIWVLFQRRAMLHLTRRRCCGRLDLSGWHLILRQHRFGKADPIAGAQGAVLHHWNHNADCAALRHPPRCHCRSKYRPGLFSRKQAKSSAAMLGNMSRLTLLSPASDAAAAAAISVSAAELIVGG